MPENCELQPLNSNHDFKPSSIDFNSMWKSATTLADHSVQWRINCMTVCRSRTSGLLRHCADIDDMPHAVCAFSKFNAAQTDFASGSIILCAAFSSATLI